MKRPPVDELKELVEITIAAKGTTTDAGNVGGTSFKDAALIGAGANSFLSMLVILYPGQPKLVDSRDITGFNTVTGEATVGIAFKGGQVPAGTPYRIVTSRFVPVEVAALEAALGTHDTDIKTLLGTIAGYIDTEIATILADADPLVMGRSQIFEKSITSAANVGDVNVATITAQPCLIEAVVIHADAAQTGDMTSCGVFGGAGKVITFISAADAVQANLDAEDKQVAWTGAVRLAATKTIVISLVGTGATAVDLTIVIKYRACASGGYLA